MSFNKVNSDGSITRVAGGTLYADAPIGSYLAMKDNSVKPQGYLLSDGRDTTGTDDELSTKYPLLYAYLGNTNILPTELDHSVLEAPEDISTNLNHTTNSSYYTAPYDGVIIINWTASDRYKSVYWSDDGTNWTEFVYNLDTSTYQTTTVPVKKGDMLYLRDSIANSVIYARFYKQYKYIKATQVGAPADFAPVDVVESGNMKAVTSNAVYDTLVNTTIIQSSVKRSVTQDPTISTWYAAELQKPTIPAGKRLVRWLGFTDAEKMAASVGSTHGGIDNCILVNGDTGDSTPITFNVWWGAEVADC